jgi:hypothetical protein
MWQLVNPTIFKFIFTLTHFLIKALPLHPQYLLQHGRIKDIQTRK